MDPHSTITTTTASNPSQDTAGLHKLSHKSSSFNDGVSPADVEDQPVASLKESPMNDVGSAIVRHQTVEDASSIDQPPSAEHRLPTSKIYRPLSLPVIALLMPASIFGVLARLGLQALVTYDGQSIFPLAYIQALGCLIMGIGLGLKEPIGRCYGPLYTALTTGFCGSLTTFSGWQLDIFDSWVNAGQFHRAWLHDLVDGIGKTVFTLSLSLASVSFGAHLASIIQPHCPALPPPNRLVRYTLTVLAVFTYAATLPAYFHLSPSFRHEATAALLFSFPGTLVRYLLSLRLNPLVRVLPLGTLSANMLGTALLGTFHVLESMRVPPGPRVCSLLEGLADGFCGCLTTVSTFAAEVHALHEGRAWLYVAVSWIGGQLLLLIILGSAFWAGNVREQITCIFS